MPHNIAVISTAFDADQMERIQKCARALDCQLHQYATADEAMPHLGDVDILFGPSDGRSPELVAAAPGLKWFASYYAGVDPLIKANVLKPDTILTNGSGAYGVTIAEHMVMVTLMLMRRMEEYQEIVENREFRSDLNIGSIYGSTFVICGTGDIGSQFAQRLRAFSPAKIIGVNRTGRAVAGFDAVIPMAQLEDVLPQADVLAMALPGTLQTDNLLTKARLAMMKKSALVINVGRGNCIDQDALIDALNAGELAGAALDVFKQEPVPNGDPAWNTKNLLFTPHCSGKMTMRHTRDVLVDTFCENLKRFCAGQPMLHVVNKNLGY